jgi:hypothetical protein
MTFLKTEFLNCFCNALKIANSKFKLELFFCIIIVKFCQNQIKTYKIY